MVDKVKQGRKNRASGAEFEKRVRKDLEADGWIVAKWPNNLKDGACVAAKAKWAGPGRPMMLGQGFPDFICYKSEENPFIEAEVDFLPFHVIFVESKVNGTLDKVEKEKAQWYLDHNYCSKFLIAFKTKEKNRVKVNYKTFGRLDGEIGES